jgi:hypothetical protein
VHSLVLTQIADLIARVRLQTDSDIYNIPVVLVGKSFDHFLEIVFCFEIPQTNEAIDFEYIKERSQLYTST